MAIEVTLPPGDATEVKTLRALLKRAEEGDATALAEVRRQFEAVPAAWEPFGNVAAQAQRAWIKVSAGGNPLVDEGICQTSTALRGELLGEAPSPLERLLVERIVACWLQVQYADRQAAQFEQAGGTFKAGEYWQKQQERAQRRYLAAIRTLAQVRRLLVPNVQVNIAENQVNVAR
jgi:hypothetical protein